MTSRRSFLLGLGAALAAPAIIKTPGLLMPVRSIILPERPSLLLQEKFGDQWVTLDQVIDQKAAFIDVIGDARRSMVQHHARSAHRNRLVANDEAYKIAVDQFRSMDRFPRNDGLGPIVGLMTLNGIPLVTT